MMTQELIDEYNRGLTDGTRMNLKGETAYLEARIRGLEDKLKERMHWLPMTDDAVFEDGKAYLVAMTMYEGSTRIDRIVYAEGSFWINDEEYETVHFSHYARITEPK